STMGDLIPGLPEEVARECLLRVGFRQLPAARRTSRQWKAEVESPLYGRLRRANGHARPILALAQALPPLAASGPAHKYAASAALSNSYRLVLHDPADGGWATLPPLPGGRGLPLFCQLAAVACVERRKPVVVGGWDPETWAPTDTVHVYDFLEGAWRSGAPMPGPRRSFFACAAAGGRVFVAGGHDEEKNALRSAVAYDAEADAWAALPDMALERDEPRGICVGARFVVVGGYPTEAPPAPARHSTQTPGRGIQCWTGWSTRGRARGRAAPRRPQQAPCTCYVVATSRCGTATACGGWWRRYRRTGARRRSSWPSGTAAWPPSAPGATAVSRPCMCSARRLEPTGRRRRGRASWRLRSSPGTCKPRVA
uniref:F-box domain-containing protein n=2 Tax=Aegilops tauschii subsp. strangulata TaxID=200361 RepID=A0A453NPJ5_AEGTS